MSSYVDLPGHRADSGAGIDTATRSTIGGPARPVPLGPAPAVRRPGQYVEPNEKLGPTGGPQPPTKVTPNVKPPPVGGPQPAVKVTPGQRPAPVGGPQPAVKVYPGGRKPPPGGIK